MNIWQKDGAKLPRIRPVIGLVDGSEDLLLQYAEEVEDVRKRRHYMLQQLDESKAALEEAQKHLLEANNSLTQEQAKFASKYTPSQALINSLTRQLLQYEHENQELFKHLEEIKQSKNYQYKENAESQLRQIVDDYAVEITRKETLSKKLSDVVFTNYDIKRQSTERKSVAQRPVSQQNLSSQVLDRKPTLGGSGTDAGQ